MEIRIDIAPLAPKEEKLQDIADFLESFLAEFLFIPTCNYN